VIFEEESVNRVVCTEREREREREDRMVFGIRVCKWDDRIGETEGL